MAGQIICVICCQRYDFITICEQSKFATHKQRKAVFCCAEIADDGLRAFAIKKRTLHLTLLVERGVINFIKKEIRFMIRVKLYWLLLGKINLKFELNELPKVSVVVFGKEKPPDFSLMKNCWYYDAVPKSFAGFGLDFA